MMSRCPKCGAEVFLQLLVDGYDVLTDPGALYVEWDGPDSRDCASFSGYKFRGVRGHTCTGSRVGYRIHVCGRPPDPMPFRRLDMTGEEDLPW